MGYETALTGRFGAPDILRAFELLQRQGALLPAAQQAQRHSFRLTERWRATLRVGDWQLLAWQCGQGAS